ncbi:MAG: insulinase family protein [Bacteroidales bacterium]|nr:insulinase family protein [Bacteroidales bacterium]
MLKLKKNPETAACFRTIVLLVATALVFSCSSKKYELKKATDKNGFSYEYVKGDPIDARMYTLGNGLKVFLSYNPVEPRISTLIGVRAGSTSDPAETTGLAHYFEHMMFKGTDEIGTLDWEKEKVYLDMISGLFEEKRATDDPEMKKEIYKKIDSLSAIAAGFVAANEYDKLVSSLGAKRTNAGTSYESTVYINDIPSNQLEKWLKLESERFTDIVLRLFHTELETVYEEFNMYQDMDQSRASNALMEGLFPTHPYGRDVIGLPEHLKNPSMVNIYEFADTWYVPNNIAIAIAGDFDFDETIMLIDKYFGKAGPNENLPEIVQPVEKEITEPVIREVIGPEAESLMLAFRFDGENSEDQKYVTLIDMILSNSQAGLIDLNLNQQQKVLRAGSGAWFMRDYGIHQFYGQPREGQTLEEVKDLLLGEIEKLKKGEFDDWMPEAVINDLRLSEIRGQENNFSRAFQMMDVFIKKVPYIDRLTFLDELEKITRQQLMDFAAANYKENYVIVYKRTGENTDLVKVEKPNLTPVEINREDQSEYYKEFSAMETGTLDPVFVDFKGEIQSEELYPGVEISYIKNKTNELFSLQYIIDMGRKHNLMLPLAIDYLPYLGTDKFSPADLQKEFFRYGLSMNVTSGEDRCYVTVSGLQKSFEKGMELIEHVLANSKADQKVYDDYLDGIVKKRNDAKLNKNTILWNALFNYGKYGQFNPNTNLLKEDKLRSVNPEDLTRLIAEIYSYRHKIFFYGQQDLGAVTPVVKKHHTVTDELKDIPEPVVYQEQPTDMSRVYFVNYDMSQTNIVMLAKGPAFDAALIPPARLFGEYFGSGLSSIVFQEIRESRALAYSAFSAFSVPGRMDQSNYIYGFVGTQADKLKIATDALLGLMNDMPQASRQFELAKESIQKQIETERIVKTNIFWTYQRNLDMGIDYDIRKDVYEYARSVTFDEFNAFFNSYIKGNNYIFLIMGNKEMLNRKAMESLGEVKDLTLEEIFNY